MYIHTYRERLSAHPSREGCYRQIINVDNTKQEQPPKIDLPSSKKPVLLRITKLFLKTCTRDREIIFEYRARHKFSCRFPCFFAPLVRVLQAQAFYKPILGLIRVPIPTYKQALSRLHPTDTQIYQRAEAR